MNQIKHEFLSSFIFFNRNIYIYIFLFFHVINKSFQFYHLFEIYSSFKVNNHNETYRNIFTFEKTKTRVKLHFCPSIRRRKSSKILQHSRIVCFRSCVQCARLYLSDGTSKLLKALRVRAYETNISRATRVSFPRFSSWISWNNRAKGRIPHFTTSQC